MLSDFIIKVKCFWEENKTDIFFVIAVFLTGIIAFGLGRLSLVLPKNNPLEIIEPAEIQTVSEINIGAACEQGGACNMGDLNITASKNGTVYYMPWCANSIKAENKLYFISAVEAEKAGYRIAKNCKN